MLNDEYVMLNMIDGILNDKCLIMNGELSEWERNLREKREGGNGQRSSEFWVLS